MLVHWIGTYIGDGLHKKRCGQNELTRHEGDLNIRETIPFLRFVNYWTECDPGNVLKSREEGQDRQDIITTGVGFVLYCFSRLFHSELSRLLFDRIHTNPPSKTIDLFIK